MVTEIERFLEAKDVYSKLSKKLVPGTIWATDEEGRLQPATYTNIETGEMFKNPKFPGWLKLHENTEP